MISSVVLFCFVFLFFNFFSSRGLEFLVISTYSYIRMYHIVRRLQLPIHAQQQAVQNFNAEIYLNIAGLKRSAMSTFAFYITLIICYLLICVLLTLYGLSIKDWETEWQFAYTLVFMNSSINPIL